MGLIQLGQVQDLRGLKPHPKVGKTIPPLKGLQAEGGI